MHENQVIIDERPPAMPPGRLAGGEVPGLTEMTGCPRLAEALAQARDRCKGASKDATNLHHNYRYASADEVIATAAAALVGSGISIIPYREELSVVGSGSMAFYALARTLLLSHSSGEFVALEVRNWPVVPDRGRPLDKAYSTALTSSLAYKLRDLLQMPRGDQFDDVAAQDDRDTPAVTAPAARAPGGPPPAVGAPAAPPAPVPASTLRTITSEQLEALQGLVRKYGRTEQEVQQMLASVGVPVLAKLPMQLMQWMSVLVTDGQVTTGQCDRIAQLVKDRKLNWDAFDRRLKERYQVGRLRQLTVRQADEVEAALKR